MAPPSIRDEVQAGLDVEPNNTFLQATDITLTGDGMQWAGTLPVGDTDVWRIKAKSGTIVDIRVVSDDNADLVADFAPIANDAERRYYDVPGTQGTEILPNIRLTPQGGFLTVKARNDEKIGEIRYHVELQRLSVENGTIESEPDDDRDAALQIPSNGQVSGTLYPSGDVDVFRTQIQSPSTISFSMPDTPAEVSVELRDKIIWSAVSKSAQVLTSDMIPADAQNVYIRVKSLDSIREIMRYQFEIAPLSEIPDEIEPNNTIDMAQVVQEEVQKLEFSLSDASDIDFFRFAASKDRVYRVRLNGIAEGMAKIAILDSKSQPLGDALSNGQVACDTSIPEGQSDLYIRVSAGAQNAEYPLKYRLNIESDEIAVVEHEPNQTREQATSLVLDQTVKGHIFPAGDVDIYRIEVPAVEGIPSGPAGVLSIDTEGGYVAALQLKLQDKDGFEISQVKNVQYSRPIHMSIDAPAGIYYLAVSGGGDNCNKAYALRSSFVANTPEQAAPPQDGAAEVAQPQPGNDAQAAAIDADVDALIRAAQAGDEPPKAQPENPGDNKAQPENPGDNKPQAEPDNSGEPKPQSNPAPAVDEDAF